MLKLEGLKAREGEFLLFKTKEIFGVDFFMMRKDKNILGPPCGMEP